jgi:hypothetical protein
VYCKTDGSLAFWDKVDKELSSIRENANQKYPNDRNKASREVHTCVTYNPIFPYQNNSDCDTQVNQYYLGSRL